MLYRVRHVNLGPIYPGVFQGAVQHLSRWANERFAGDIFLVARLLAYQHQGRAFRPFAENRLGRVPKQMAGCARLRGGAESREALGLRHRCRNPVPLVR